MEYEANGTLTLEVSKKITASNENEAAQKLGDYCTYGIRKIKVVVEYENGEVHNLEVNDNEMEWDSLIEVENKKEKPLDTECLMTNNT